MRYFLMVILIVGGCQPKRGPETPDTKPGFTPVVPGSVIPKGYVPVLDRTLDAKDLADLRIFLEGASTANGRLPGKEVLPEIAKASPNLGKSIEAGTCIINWGGSREGVWAYDKSALQSGGMVLLNDGVQRMTAAALKQRLEGQ